METPGDGLITEKHMKFKMVLTAMRWWLLFGESSLCSKAMTGSLPGSVCEADAVLPEPAPEGAGSGNEVLSESLTTVSPLISSSGFLLCCGGFSIAWILFDVAELCCPSTN
jgi:hypothetical protein